jgi:titin
MSYQFKIQTVASSGTVETAASSTTTLYAVPGAPTNLLTTPGNQTVSLSWTAPADDGGTAITDYLIEVNSGSGWSTFTDGTSSATSATVTGLENGTEYNFRVSAINAAGTGDPSDTGLASGTTPRTVPGVVGTLGSTYGNQTVTLTWTAPANDGGAPIESYRIEYHDGDGAWDLHGNPASASVVIDGSASYVVTGLSNGTTYSFRVSAVNVAGTGTTGTAITAQPRTTPSQPRNIAATAGQSTATVSWDAPADNGGVPITGYLVEYHDGDGLWVATSTASGTATTITGLSTGITYSFRVSAENSEGYGAFSGTSTAATYTVPDAPTGVSATAGNAQLAVTWTAPASNGGATITDYLVEYNSGSGWATFTDGVSTSTTATITGLTNGTAYQVRVSAINVAGTGTGSNASAARTPRTVATAPINFTATPGNGQVELSWTAPASDGGAAITDYFVYYLVNPSTVLSVSSAGATSYTVTGLTNGGSYDFRVHAVNAAGAGAQAYSATVIPRTVPDAPTNLQATAGNQTTALTWTAPADTGGVAITDYLVEINSGSGWQTFADGVSTSTSATVTGLSNGTSHTFRVSAINVAGTGSASSTATATPYTVPGAPVITSSSSDASSVAVYFTAPASNGGNAITGYQVACSSSNGGTSRSSTGSGSPITVSSLSEGKNYSCLVAATNAAGYGANSNAVALAAFQVDPDDYAATANYAEAVGSYAATANTTATLVGGDCSFGYGDIALVAQAGYAGHVWGCEEHQWVGWPIDVGGWGSYCETGEFYRGNGGCYLWNVVYAGTPAYSYSTSYSCPSGGDLSGTNCFYTYSYIASYSCPSGGSLSGSTCIRPAYWAGWNRTVT